MDAVVIRYCPACGARVQAHESVFEGPCVCPTCHERSQFYDYPRETPATPAKTRSRTTATWYDWLLWGVLGVASLAAIVVLWAMMNGWANAALIGAGVCLLAGLSCAAHIGRLKRNLFRATDSHQRAERALVVSNSKLQAASEIHQGFKKNFDALVADEKRRLQDEIAARREKAEEMYAEASQLIAKHKSKPSEINTIGDRFLDQAVQWISRELNSSNLSDSRNQMKQLIEFCRDNGCTVKSSRERELMHRLEIDHQTMMLEAKYTNERLRIEAKVCEEQRVIEEMEQDIRKAEAERSTIQKSLSTVLKQSPDLDTVIVDDLKMELDSAERRILEATKTMKQPAAGFVYVLSNVGSFGKNVFKIASTRRADPRQHVEELSGLAVPFPYDIHMMIPTENTEELEAALHEALHECRVNRFNHGKDFFQTDIKTIWQLVIAHHGTVDYVEKPIAKEYSESLQMSDEAFQQITDMYRTSEKYRDPFERKPEQL